MKHILNISKWNVCFICGIKIMRHKLSSASHTQLLSKLLSPCVINSYYKRKAKNALLFKHRLKTKCLLSFRATFYILVSYAGCGSVYYVYAIALVFWSLYLARSLLFSGAGTEAMTLWELISVCQLIS